MRHFMPEELRHERFPAIKSLPTLDGWTAFACVSEQKVERKRGLKNADGHIYNFLCRMLSSTCFGSSCKLCNEGDQDFAML
jgi:hypothetical protein